MAKNCAPAAGRVSARTISGGRRAARRSGAGWAPLLLGLAGCAPLPAQETLLCGFEGPEALREWEVVSGTARLVPEGATQGRQALEVVFDPAARYHGAYLGWRRVPREWSAHDALALDVTNPNPGPVPASLLVADQAWADRGRTYWNRHNAQTAFPPGRSRWVIPVRGLYRGEAGCRNVDLKGDIDSGTIVRLDLGFGARGAAGRILLDNVRFLRAGRPGGVWAFDLGPPGQALMPGWTPVSQETVYTKERGHGWGPRGGRPWDGAARDTTFGGALLQDFCEAGGYAFRVDVPPGRYRAAVLFENAGYWGGEQALHRERRILAGETAVWREARPDGAAHPLYRFEGVEPVGVDLWETYMAAELARPALFDVEAGSGGLVLRFEADRTWGSKVAGLALHRQGDAAAAAWLAGELAGVAAEFRRRAVCLDPAGEPVLPPAWREAPLAAWPAGLEEEVWPGAGPPPGAPGPAALELSRLAVRGEAEHFGLCLKPRRDLGVCALRLEPLAGPGSLPARVRVAWYGLRRGFGDVSHRVRPHTLREQERVELKGGVTRLAVVTVRVPEGASPGEYRGALQVVDAGGTGLLRVPLRLAVSPATLRRETGFAVGFFGLDPPAVYAGEARWEVLSRTLELLRERGFNSVSGGPNFFLKGWRGADPVVDFGEMDRFFALLGAHGFRRPLNGYGGARFLGLHDGYRRGAAAVRVESESGLPYEEACRRAWAAVAAHGREAGWPPIYYAMCDETRVREAAEAELDFMRLMAGVSGAFPETVRTSGSYSVHFRSRPEDPEDLLHWHQRFFQALDVSSLNGHDAGVLAEAARTGREVHIYNQGRSRFAFGLYQWREHRAGVKARWEWHLNILHGYQFFDLDGREPDPAMICYGREGLIPTIDLERCSEGLEDFFLLETLAGAAVRARQEGRREPAVAAAAALLEELAESGAPGDRRPPPGFDAEALKRRVVAALEALAGR